MSSLPIQRSLEGYVPRTANLLDIGGGKGEYYNFSYHSEKIAVAFMILNTVPGESNWDF